MVCGLNSSAVIVESLPAKKKKKKSQKRVLTIEEIQSMSMDRIKMENEARMAKAKAKDKSDREKEREEIEKLQRRIPLQDRFRKKWHEMTFGYKEKEKWNDESKQQKALQELREEEAAKQNK